MIELQNVRKHFGSVKAVDGISFAARPGNIFGLIGPNGAGKSTTIRMIMNILAPDSGNIYFSGETIGEKDKERIGYLPEERGLYKKVKVNDLLLYFCALKGKNRAWSQEKIDFWLKKFDLLAWKERKIEELSKGMTQKIQFIAAVAHDPDLLFFDEPFSGIDPVSADIITESIIDLGKEGKTILFSTHIMENAEKICSDIFLMNKGSEIVSGSLQDIKNTYGSRSIIVECDGDTEFLNRLPQVDNFIRYPRWLEIQLIEEASQEEFLRLLAAKLRIRKYEIVSPTLHKIFVSLVKEEAGNE